MIEKKMIRQAVKILQDLNKKNNEDSSKKKALLDDEECSLYLQVTLKKIPKSELIQMIKVPLPHSLLKDSNEVCLITGDLDKKNHKAEIEPDVLHYKQLLGKHNIDCISEVVTLRQLRTDFKPYEAKQKLLAAYDVFLADKKIAECLPRVLGRHFFKKRKFPIQIDMKSPNLKNQIEKALSTKIFHITGRGNSCASEVAHLGMEDSEIIENVLTVTKVLSEQLPGQSSNINGIYLKTSKSKAIPVYMSYESPNEIQLESQPSKKKKRTNEIQSEELENEPSEKKKRPKKIKSEELENEPSEKKKRSKEIKSEELKNEPSEKKKRPNEIKSEELENEPSEKKKRPKKIKSEELENEPSEKKKKPNEIKSEELENQPSKKKSKRKKGSHPKQKS